MLQIYLIARDLDALAARVVIFFYEQTKTRLVGNYDLVV